MNDQAISLALIFILIGAVGFVSFRIGVMYQILKDNHRARNHARRVKRILEEYRSVEDVKKN